MSLTCYDYLVKRYKSMGDFNALLNYGTNIKMSKFLSDCDAVAGYINSIGIKTGETVTVFLPTTVHAFSCFYSLNKIGIIANFVHPLTSPELLYEIMVSTKSKAIFVLDILAEKYSDVINKANIPCVICSTSDYVSVIKTPAFLAFEKVKAKGLDKFNNKIKYSKVIKIGSGKKTEDCHDGELTAVYLHGGGTTGKSKTIMLSSDNINAIAEKLVKLDIKHKPGDEYSLVVLPMFHAFGLAVAMHFPICNGFTCIPISQFDAQSANNLIKRHNVTFILGVPNMFKKMYDQKNFKGPHLRKLRLLFCGGDFLPQKFVNEFNSAISECGGKGQLFRGYGLTEVASVCTVNSYTACKAESIGRPLDGITIEIWDEKQNAVPDGEIGEIAVKGDTVMQGYFTGDNSVRNDGVYTDKRGERWVQTGDLGYKDKDGFVFFTGRKKRMIIISGYNVYPIDIENEVLKIPFISEACAVQGYQKNKPCVKLCVTLKYPMNRNDAINEIQSYCKKNLAKFSCPRKIEIMDSFPRTKMAKVDFMKLSDKYDRNA